MRLEDPIVALVARSDAAPAAVTPLVPILLGAGLVLPSARVRASAAPVILHLSQLPVMLSVPVGIVEVGPMRLLRHEKRIGPPGGGPIGSESERFLRRVVSDAPFEEEGDQLLRVALRERPPLARVRHAAQPVLEHLERFRREARVVDLAVLAE